MPKIEGYPLDNKHFEEIYNGTSKNYSRHAELVSASPYLQGIADQARNDESQKTEFLEVPIKEFLEVSFIDFDHQSSKPANKRRCEIEQCTRTSQAKSFCD